MLKPTLKALNLARKWLTAGSTKGELAVKLGTDVLGAGAGALFQPGDLGDKAIAFGTDLGLSTTLGLGAGRLVGGGKGLLSVAADTAGSYAGAFGSIPVTNQLLRAKDGLVGTGNWESPWERESREQQQQLLAAAEQRALENYMIMFPQSRALLGNQIS